MNDPIEAYFNDLSAEQADRLLAAGLKVSTPDAGAARRIWARSLERAGLATPKKQFVPFRKHATRKLAAVLAAVAVLISATLTVTAFYGVYKFVPGFGKVTAAVSKNDENENEDQTLYTAAAFPTVAHQFNDVALTQLLAQDGKVQMAFTSYGDPDALTGNVTVDTGVKKYTIGYDGFSLNLNAGGPGVYNELQKIYIRFSVSPKEIYEGAVYKISLPISTEMQVTLTKAPDAEDICKNGPTVTHNGISITAIARPQRDDAVDSIQLFPSFENGNYTVANYNPSNQTVGIRSSGILLITDSGTSLSPWNCGGGAYCTGPSIVTDPRINDDVGILGEYVFSIPAGEQPQKLVTAGVSVFSDEANIPLTVPVPENGGSLPIHQTVDFADGTYTFTEVQSVSHTKTTDGDPVYDTLRVIGTFEMKTPNAVLTGIRVDGDSGVHSGDVRTPDTTDYYFGNGSCYDGSNVALEIRDDSPINSLEKPFKNTATVSLYSPIITFDTPYEIPLS